MYLAWLGSPNVRLICRNTIRVRARIIAREEDSGRRRAKRDFRERGVKRGTQLCQLEREGEPERVR